MTSTNSTNSSKQYGALTYEQMRALLEMPQYQARDDATLQALARQQVEPSYNAQTQAARQKHAQTDLSLSNQLASLTSDAASRSATAQANTAQALRNQQASSLRRGMQRSSYNQAAQAGIEGQGIHAQDQIAQSLNQQRAGVESQRQLEAQQLAETLARLDTDHASNVSGAVKKLQDEDYTRATDAQKMRNELSQWLASSYWLNAMGRTGGMGALGYGF